MRTAAFTAKIVPLDNLRGDGPWDFSPPGEKDDTYAVAECFLWDFQCCGYDKAGRNAYSLQVYLNGDRIVRIDRIGHCHMCGGQGSDTVLDRFPHRSLEDEAQVVMSAALRRRKRKRFATVEPPPTTPAPKLVDCRCLGLVPERRPYPVFLSQRGPHPRSDCPACHGTGKCKPEDLTLVPFEACEPRAE